MSSFTFDGIRTRTLFGPGSRARLDGELERMGLRRLLFISGAGHPMRDEILGLVAPRVAHIFAGAVMHTPVDVTERAMDLLQASNVDGLLAMGGGSATGLSKALALRTDLPQIILPTTYAGSECTAVLGQTEGGIKTTLQNERVRPEVVVYDVDMTMSLPVAMSGASGFNALAHAVEALYARDANPVIDLLALQGIRALTEALPSIAATPHDGNARSAALYGAWLCGVCLGSVGMSLHHKLCHAIGGSFTLPHAETHAIVLPHALAYNLPLTKSTGERLESVLGGQDAPSRLFELARRLGLPRGLRDLGMPEDGIERAADVACSNPYWNPRPIERGSMGKLVRRAWAGDPPASID